MRGSLVNLLTDIPGRYCWVYHGTLEIRHEIYWHYYDQLTENSSYAK